MVAADPDHTSRPRAAVRRRVLTDGLHLWRREDRDRPIGSLAVAWEMGEMWVLAIGLLALVVVNGCAAMKRTEDLPTPAGDAAPGGPEGEPDSTDSF